MHAKVKEAWDRDWNYSIDFYCTLDASMTVTSANSAYKEWFHIMVGEPLVGLCLTPAARINPLIGVEGNGWMVMRRPALRVSGDVVYRAKAVKDDAGELVGYVVKSEYLEPNIMQIDEEMAQMRLNGFLTFDQKIVKLAF